MRGQPPKPRAQRIAEGNPGRRPLPNEPAHQPGVPVMPKNASAEAEVVWNELLATMDPRILCQTDRRALWALAEDEAILAHAYSGFWKMVKALGKKAKAENRELPAGEIMSLLTMPSGRQAMSAVRDLAARVIVERREFGLTPSARTRIAAGRRHESDTAIDDAIFSQSAELFLLPKSG